MCRESEILFWLQGDEFCDRCLSADFRLSQNEKCLDHTIFNNSNRFQAGQKDNEHRTDLSSLTVHAGRVILLKIWTDESLAVRSLGSECI